MSNKPKLNPRQEQVITTALVRFMMLGRNSLSPTQEKIATDSAGELLWLLDVPEYTFEGRKFLAKEPELGTIDLVATRLLEG